MNRLTQTSLVLKVINPHPFGLPVVLFLEISIFLAKNMNVTKCKSTMMQTKINL